MKVLITGLSGLIGGATRAALEADHTLSALNRSAVDGLATFRADIANFESIRPAFAGQDAVIHLAAKAGENYTLGGTARHQRQWNVQRVAGRC